MTKETELEPSKYIPPMNRRIVRRFVLDAGAIPGTYAVKRSKQLNRYPRWHTTSCLLYLALRQHPKHTLSRKDIIQKAMQLDKEFSAQLRLPKLFKGKTPSNSASAALTRNYDRYFIPFRPEGSVSMYFKLAFDPGNVNAAVQEYQTWCQKLVEQDWPSYFDTSKEVNAQANHLYCTPVSDDDDMDLAAIKVEQQASTTALRATTPSTASEPAESTVDDPVTVKKEKVPDTLLKEEPLTDEAIHFLLETTAFDDDKPAQHATTVDTSTAEKTEDGFQRVTVIIKQEPTPPTTKPTRHTQPNSKNIPQSWRDIVTIAPSSLNKTRNGLFATRTIPHNAPIGFYFGVPMTEGEFISLKGQQVDRSSAYAIMSGRTALDATDEQGQPVTDRSSPRFCPFHFMNEAPTQQDASVAFVQGEVSHQVMCWTRKEIQPGEELLVK